MIPVLTIPCPAPRSRHDSSACRNTGLTLSLWQSGGIFRTSRPARRKSKTIRQSRGDEADDVGNFERDDLSSTGIFNAPQRRGSLEPEKSCLLPIRPSHATHSPVTTKHPSTPVLRTHERGRQQLAPFVGFSSFHSAPSKKLSFYPHRRPLEPAASATRGILMVQSKRRDLWDGRGQLPAHHPCHDGTRLRTRERPCCNMERNGRLSFIAKRKEVHRTRCSTQYLVA
jgi:hypothetical protein